MVGDVMHLYCIAKSCQKDEKQLSGPDCDERGLSKQNILQDSFFAQNVEWNVKVCVPM